MITWDGTLQEIVTTITLRPDSLLQPQLFTREGTQMEVAVARVRTRVNQSPLCQNWLHELHMPIIAVYVICRQLSYLGHQPRKTSIVLCVAPPVETAHMLTSSAEDVIITVTTLGTPLSLEKREKEKTRA
jgi:hypothetical protein